VAFLWVTVKMQFAVGGTAVCTAPRYSSSAKISVDCRLRAVRDSQFVITTAPVLRAVAARMLGDRLVEKE